MIESHHLDSFTPFFQEYSLKVQQLALGPKTKNASSNPNFLGAVCFKQGSALRPKKIGPL